MFEVQIGRMNTLKAVRETDFGMYLEGGPEFGEILMPKRYVPQGLRPGRPVDVFVYYDSEDRIVATTEKPKAQVGEFALLKVIEVNTNGAFLDWGLSKDLLLPYSEQQKRLGEGELRTVRLFLDDRTRRIVATTKIDRFLNQTPAKYQPGEEVTLYIYGQTDIGWSAIVNDAHWGLILNHEIFEPLQGGTRRKGYVKGVREDGKIDLALNAPGYAKVGGVADEIMTMLKAQGGFLPLTDKTSPAMIHKIFGVSKKAFKQAVGALYKKRLITLEEKGIRLVK